MYDNKFETKENKIWIKDKINHNIYNERKRWPELKVERFL